MKRLWFKERMKDAILHGSKKATTRKTPLIIGEEYQAVSGSRYKAQKFATLRIVKRQRIEGPLVNHFRKHFREEGFRTYQDFIAFLEADLPEYLIHRPLFYHTFEVVSTVMR